MRREPSTVPAHLLRQLRAAQLQEVDGPAVARAVEAIDRWAGFVADPCPLCGGDHDRISRRDGCAAWWVLRRVPDVEGTELAELRTDGERTWWVVGGAGR